MSPQMRQILDNKAERRKKLATLPYVEKVRIVEMMRQAGREIRAKAKRVG